MSTTASGTGNEPHVRSKWRINRVRVEYGKPYKIIVYEANRRVALVYKEGNDVYFNEKKADEYAELICRAVNSHDKLVEALEAVKFAISMESILANSEAWQGLKDDIDKALKLAKP